jgi:hypothetical protein
MQNSSTVTGGGANKQTTVSFATSILLLTSLIFYSSHADF